MKYKTDKELDEIISDARKRQIFHAECNGRLSIEDIRAEWDARVYKVLIPRELREKDEI